MTCYFILNKKRIIDTLIVNIVIFHICSVIIIEAPTELVELNSGSIVYMQVRFGINVCVKYDMESIHNLRA